MRKVLKWLGIAVGALVGILVIAFAAIYLITEGMVNEEYDVEPEVITIPADEEAIARGRHLSIIAGCTDCHGANLAGGPMIEDPVMANLYAANLTAGEGGIGQTHSDADLVRSIRHGVGPDGKSLWVMPAQEFYHLSDEDLGSLIAYLRTLPAVDNSLPENSAGPLGRILTAAGQIDLLPAALIDHQAARPVAPEPGETAEYGAYLAVFCQGCHGKDYAGGPLPGSAPEDPLAANLTPSGELGEWSEEDFIQTLRTGVDPEGHQLNAEFMPWPNIGQMSDLELKALWAYLQSVPPAQES